MSPLWLQLAYVLVGGAVGSGLRFIVSEMMTAQLGRGWPWGTFTVNLVGALIAGVLMSWQASKGDSFGALRPLLIIGFIGGLTTFSTLMVEVMMLISSEKLLDACVYLATSIVCGLLLVVLGALLGRWLLF